MWSAGVASYLMTNPDLHALIWLDTVRFARLMSLPTTGKVLTESSSTTLESAMNEQERPEDEHEPPKGTLIMILIYLLLLVLLWTNVYLRLWVRG